MSQSDQILRRLKTCMAGITPMEALADFGCFRLASRINELRDMGYDIDTIKENKNGKTYARYVLNRKNGILHSLCQTTTSCG